MNKKIEEIALQTHIKWLPKAKTAKIDGSEMTVLPYGYLSQAVIEVIEQERERIIEEIEEMKIEIEPQAEGTDVDDTMRTINNTLSDVINKIKNIK